MDAVVMCGGEGRRLDADREKPLVPVAGRPMVDRVLDALVGVPDGSEPTTDSSAGIAPGPDATAAGPTGADPPAADRDGGRGAQGVDRVVAAVSPSTPDTADHLRGRTGVTVLETGGEGYVADLGTALAAVATPALTVAADLPLLAPGAVERVRRVHDRRADGGSLTVRVPRALKVQLGTSVDEGVVVRDGGRAYLPAGINVVGELDPSGTDDLDSTPEPDDAGSRDGAGGASKTSDTEDTMYTTYDARLAVNVNRPADVTVAEALLCD